MVRDRLDKVADKALCDTNNANALGASNFQGGVTPFRYFDETSENPDLTEDAVYQAIKAKGTRWWGYARKTAKLSTAAWEGDDESRRRADAEDLTHDEPKIEATGMNQQPLQDVRVTAQMGATHPARVIDMREGAFDRLATSTHQAPAAGSTNPATIAIHGCLRFRMLRPVASTSVGLRDMTGCHGVEVHHRLIAVIALVRNDLFQRLGRLDVGLRVFGLIRRGRRVSTIVVVSPWSAPCKVTATIAPVSRSTACSALCARCVGHLSSS